MIDRFTLMALNLQYGGVADEWGRKQARFPRIVERVQRLGVNLLLTQEFHGCLDNGAATLLAAMDRLGMFPVVGRSQSTAHLVTFVDRTVFEVLSSCTWHHPEVPYHAVLAVRLRHRRTGHVIQTVNVHLNPFARDAADLEVRQAASFANHGGDFALVAGDVNYGARGDRTPPASAFSVPDRASRTDVSPDGELVLNYKVVDRLAAVGLVDVGGHVADQSGDPSTRTRPGTRKPRVDHHWLSRSLLAGVVEHRLLDMGELSDHPAPLTVVDMARIAAADRG